MKINGIWFVFFTLRPRLPRLSLASLVARSLVEYIVSSSSTSSSSSRVVYVTRQSCSESAASGLIHLACPLAEKQRDSDEAGREVGSCCRRVVRYEEGLSIEAEPVPARSVLGRIVYRNFVHVPVPPFFEQRMRKCSLDRRTTGRDGYSPGRSVVRSVARLVGWMDERTAGGKDHRSVCPPACPRYRTVTRPETRPANRRASAAPNRQGKRREHSYTFCNF